MKRFRAAVVLGAAVFGAAMLNASPVSAAPGRPPLAVQLVPSFTKDLPVGHTTVRAQARSVATKQSKTRSAVVTAATVPWVCSVYASDPYKSSEGGKQVIEGHGWQSCTGYGYHNTKLQITVQQYRGLGIWADKYTYNSAWGYSAWLEHWVWWNCAKGTGNQLYRIVTRGYAQSGAYSQGVQSQNYLRVTCPS
ncbi:MAG: hypothetical protein JWN95_4137 [Frankiales bacterium]|nr:hypothetical protein [Frankiales bacterium]